MEIVIAPETLREKLKIFQNLVLKDGGATDVSNLMFQTGEGERLFIFGTDLDVNLRTEIEPELLQVISPGAIAVKAHKLIDMLGTLDGKVKSIRLREEENGWASALFGRSHFKIAGIKANLFPQVSYDPPPEAPQVSFPAGLLLQFLNSTGFAVSNQDTKYAISGSNLTINESGSRMVGTDGFRIAVIDSKIAGQLEVLIPKKPSGVLARLLSEIDPETPVTLSQDPNLLYATVGAYRLSFRKLAGDFPDVTKAIPAAQDYRVLFDLYDLRWAIRRADMFAQKDAHSPVTLTIRNGEMEIASRSFEEGSGTEVIDAVYDGEEKKVKISSKYLVDFFSSIGETQVTLAMQFSDNEKVPTVWSVHRDGAADIGFDYKCVITRLQ